MVLSYRLEDLHPFCTKCNTSYNINYLEPAAYVKDTAFDNTSVKNRQMVHGDSPPYICLLDIAVRPSYNKAN